MSFDLTDEQLGALFDQITVLAGRPREVEELPGGLTNRNLKVTTPEGEFVARCTDPQADALGIDREAEHHNTRVAADAGVGAPVHDFRPDLGILVIGWLEGRTWTREDLPGNLPRVAEATRRLHAADRFQGDFDMFERQAGYLRTVTQGGYRLPDGYLDLAPTLERVRTALAVLDEGTVPCHNDLLAENFVDDGDRLWLIDYEYAGNNDACFELGNIACECRLTGDQLEELVTAYFEGPRPSKLARARLLGAVGQWGWTLWGAIQHAVSPLDFDFWEWTLERWELAQRDLRGPGLESLLDAVTQDDA